MNVNTIIKKALEVSHRAEKQRLNACKVLSLTLGVKVIGINDWGVHLSSVEDVFKFPDARWKLRDSSEYHWEAVAEYDGLTVYAICTDAEYTRITLKIRGEAV